MVMVLYFFLGTDVRRRRILLVVAAVGPLRPDTIQDGGDRGGEMDRWVVGLSAVLQGVDQRLGFGVSEDGDVVVSEAIFGSGREEGVMGIGYICILLGVVNEMRYESFVAPQVR